MDVTVGKKARTWTLLLAAVVAVLVLSACGSTSESTAKVEEDAAVEDDTSDETAATAPITATTVPDAVTPEPVEATEQAVEAAEAAADAEPTAEVAAGEFDEAEMMLGMLAAFGLDLTSEEETCVAEGYGAIPDADPDSELETLIDDCTEGDLGSRLASGLVEAALTDAEGFNADERACVSEGIGSVMSDAMFGQELSDNEVDFGFELAAANCGVFGRVSALDGLIPDDGSACVDAEALASPPEAPALPGTTNLDPYLGTCGVSLN